MASVAGIKTGAGGAGLDDAGDGAGVDAHAAEAAQGGVSIKHAGIEIFRHVCRDAPWHVGDPARAREEPGLSGRRRKPCITRCNRPLYAGRAPQPVPPDRSAVCR